MRWGVRSATRASAPRSLDAPPVLDADPRGSMTLAIHKASRLDGVLKVPGDKSISHRALILGAAARGRQTIDGIADSADVRTTMEALRTMGCFVESMPDGRTIVLSHTITPEFDIDAGNSGTTGRTRVNSPRWSSSRPRPPRLVRVYFAVLIV